MIRCLPYCSSIGSSSSSSLQIVRSLVPIPCTSVYSWNLTTALRRYWVTSWRWKMPVNLEMQLPHQHPHHSPPDPPPPTPNTRGIDASTDEVMKEKGNKWTQIWNNPKQEFKGSFEPLMCLVLVISEWTVSMLEGRKIERSEGFMPDDLI